MNGITIREPFITQILEGKKEWEFRAYACPDDFLNCDVYLLNAGRVRGIVQFDRSLQLPKAIALQLAPSGRIYKATHAWHIKSVKPLPQFSATDHSDELLYRWKPLHSLYRDVETFRGRGTKQTTKQL